MSVDKNVTSAGHHPHRRLFAFGLGTALIGANLRAPITSVGPILPVIQKSLDLSESQAGMLNSLPLLVFALLSLVAPGLGRRFGLERTIAAAMVALIAGMFVRSGIAGASALWVGTAVLSVGIAFGNVLLPGLVKREAPAQASFLIALYAASMAAAAGVAAGAAQPLAAAYGGRWTWALGWWMALAVLALLVWLPQCARVQHHLRAPSAGGAVARSPWTSGTGWLVSLFFAFHSIVFYSIVAWYPSFVAGRGVPLAESGLHLLVYQVVAVSSNLACGPILKRAKSQVPLGLVCGSLLVLGAGGITLGMPIPVFWLSMAGVGAGIAMTTSLSLFGLRTADHHSAAKLSGMAQFVGYIGAACGPLLIGVIRQATGDWNTAMMIPLACSVFALITGAMAGRDRTI